MKWGWLKIARYARPQAAELAVMLLLTLVNVGIGLLSPWPLKLVVDSVIPGRALPDAVQWLGALPGADSPKGMLTWLAAATVILFLCRRLIGVARGYVAIGAGTRMVYNLSTELFHALQRRNLIFHGKQRVGDLVQRVIEDTHCVRELVMDVALPVITSLATLVGMLVIMWKMDYRLALLALSVAVPLGLITRYFAEPMVDLRVRGKKLHGEMTALAEQTLTALPIVQAFGRENHEDARYRELANRALRAKLSSVLTQQQFRAASSSVTTLATVAVTVIGSFSVLGGDLTLGGLLVLLSYFSSLYSPLETIAYMSETTANASAGARRVLEVMESDEEHAIREAPGAKPFPPQHDGRGAAVRFDHVTFGYEPGRPVLRDVCLEIQPGETLALVGHTGAGKSTLMFLLPRLYDPWSGVVEIDGCDLRGIQLKSLRTNVAVVLQEALLLPLTVAENIAYGRPGATRAEVVAASQAANAHEFIEKLREGYDSVIGERGMTLSIGQRQRLTIARALLMDAPVLVLDEPTSALDTETEASLLQALERLTRGRTTLIIAHRLSTVRMADRIVVLEEGRVVETGTPAQLMDADGRYARLIRLQSTDRMVADRERRAAV